MEFNTSSALLREASCQILIELARKDPRIVVLDADLMNSSGLSKFSEEFPGRTFNCGIQECNMVGVAGGLSAAGMIPLIHSFAAFAGRRVVDQVFLAGVYAHQNLKILATDPGSCGSGNGGSHMALEDIGIMRSMAGITILDPSDEVQLRSIMPQVMENPGVHYIRLYRKTNRKIYADGTKFVLGKSYLTREGSDVTIIAEGAVMVPEALLAAELLAQDGIQARVVDMFTIKPLDKEAVVRAARETGAVLTAENHNIYNGLGSAVAEVLAEERLAVPFGRIGFCDTVGETADMDFIMKKFGLDFRTIAARAKRLATAK